MYEKLIDILPIENGIFSILIPKLEYEWLTIDDALILDESYLLGHSGMKNASMYLSRMIERKETVASALDSITNYIKIKFDEKWRREYLALIESEYNPIENYDSHETETPNIKNKRITKTDMDVTRETNNDIYAFNDDNASPLNKGTETTSASSNTNIVDDENNETGTRKIERHGNIGVTTNQQMITQEIEMRDKFILIDIIMNDIDSILAHPIYK